MGDKTFLLKEKSANYLIISSWRFTYCCPKRTRTSSDRTKNCSATITPWDNPYFEFATKVMKFSFLHANGPKILTSLSTGNNSSFRAVQADTCRQGVNQP